MGTWQDIAKVLSQTFKPSSQKTICLYFEAVSINNDEIIPQPDKVQQHLELITEHCIKDDGTSVELNNKFIIMYTERYIKVLDLLDNCKEKYLGLKLHQEGKKEDIKHQTASKKLENFSVIDVKVGLQPELLVMVIKKKNMKLNLFVWNIEQDIEVEMQEVSDHYNIVWGS